MTTKNHIIPVKNYLLITAALFVLTVVTVAVSFVDLGGFNVVVALAVASVKATLVALFFMHLWYDNKLYMLIFVIAIVILAVFIIIIMFDVMTRDDIYQFAQSLTGLLT